MLPHRHTAPLPLLGKRMYYVTVASFTIIIVITVPSHSWLWRGFTTIIFVYAYILPSPAGHRPSPFSHRHTAPLPLLGKRMHYVDLDSFTRFIIITVHIYGQLRLLQLYVYIHTYYPPTSLLPFFSGIRLPYPCLGRDCTTWIWIRTRWSSRHG